MRVLREFARGIAFKKELIMSRMALVIAFVLALIGPASAQKAEIEAANAK